MNEIILKYTDGIPKDRKEIVEKLHVLIMDLYPNAKVDMSYKMPTYRFRDGWVALANQKHYVSLYTCGPQHIADFKEKNPAIKTGKGCINLKPTDAIPYAALKQVVKHAIEHPK